jgi:DNA-binding HxlR family transcriptional regulator
MVDSAELFEAIAHPVRIKILKILEKQPSSFASLKRHLGYTSSGNLDYHLKKLGALVAVREDGLYGLTQAGKEALLSIDAVEMWTEIERHKIKMFAKMPKEALFLGLFEVCTTVTIFLFFLTLVQLPLSWNNIWGFLFLGALLLTGLRSGFGIFARWTWSWTMVLAKSTLVMSMSLFLLNYLRDGTIVNQSSSIALFYLVFAAAEIVAVGVALTHPVKDFLGIGKIKLSYLGAFGGLLCISSGLLLIILLSARRFADITVNGPISTVFASISDTSILCGLLITVGGVLILAGSSTLGAAISIIFGFFPPRLNFLPPPLAQMTAYHAFDLIWSLDKSSFYVFLIAVAVGSLPIVGGLLALTSKPRFRT